MTIRTSLLCVFVVLALWTSPAQAQVFPHPTPCDSSSIAPWNDKFVCGKVDRVVTNTERTTPPFDTGVFFCPEGYRPSSNACTGAAIRYYTNGYTGGTYAGYRIERMPGTGYRTWDVFVYSGGYFFGSNEAPIRRVSIDSDHGAQLSTLLMLPRPRPPTHLSPPPDATNYPSEFTLSWYTGMDSARYYFRNMVKFDFYYKYWPYGTAEPDGYTAWATDYQCAPNTAGNCSTYITDMPPGNYRWYIVAKLDFSGWVSPELRPAIFSTATSAAYLGIGSWTP